MSGHLYVADSVNARVDEFTAWGEFVKAWGWGVDTGQAKLETCTSESECQAGISGSGVGQFSTMRGVVVDFAGNVYVSSENARRVQKFSPDGEFLLMFGGEVNKTKSAEGGTTMAERNLCTAADMEAGDVCGEGVAGTGQGQFGFSGLPMSIGPGDVLYIGDVGRVQKFDTDGHFTGEVIGALAGETVNALAVNGSGIYVGLRQGPGTSKADVRKLDGSGVLLETLPASNARALALDAEGGLYVSNQHRFVKDGLTTTANEILIYGPSGTCVVCEAETVAAAKANFAAPEDEVTQIQGLASNVVTEGGESDLYAVYQGSGSFTPPLPQRGYVRIFGPPPDFWPPPPVSPEVVSQYAASVDREGASVRAQIDPKFWKDTRYYVEYGTGACSEAGCPLTRPAPPGSLLTSKVVSESLTTATINLPELESDTTYHYRFVAESSGGGPIYGIDPDGVGADQASFEDGLEGTLRTYPAKATGADGCVDAAFRSGPATSLPECRAHELVSPLDKDNGDVIVQLNLKNNAARLDQAAIGGDALTYSTYRAFEDTLAAPYSSQYLARREAVTGWASEPISPPQQGPAHNSTLLKDSQYKAFLPDLSMGWLQYDSELTLDPAAQPGFLNFYRRDNATGDYEALIRDTPPSSPTSELQGVSADGSCAVFRATEPLTPDASTEKQSEFGFQVYESCDGMLTLVSVLPGGAATDQDSSVGTPKDQLTLGREGSLANAISADGSRVFWSESLTGPGKLFVRQTSGTPQTVAVSDSSATFWAAAEDGSEVIFSEGGALYRMDVNEALGGSAVKELIAGGVEGVLGVTEDAETLYFISTEALEGGAVAGKSNLYLSSPESPVFIGGLSTADVGGSGYAPGSLFPLKHASRVSPDGRFAVFMSSAPLTGQDNLEVKSGEPTTQVYRYDAEADELLCVSCNPAGARPVGQAVNGEDSPDYFAASKIPVFSSQLYAPRVLSEDGNRLFFESFDALLPEDTNGAQDVYEWRLLDSAGCKEEDPHYFEPNGGCIDLISSGESPKDSSFVDSSADGKDVFFKTAASLLSWDPGLVDIYDARIGGGFPGPPIPPAICQGEACQRPAGAPEDPTPASSAYRGPGNLAAPSAASRCPKGKRKVRRGGKARCVPARRQARGAKAEKREQKRTAGRHRSRP